MEIDFFKSQIETLRKTYGAGTYPPMVAKSIWERVSHISEERFLRTIGICLAENPKYAFGIDKIDMALSQVREEKWNQDKKTPLTGNVDYEKIAEWAKSLREEIGKK